MLNTIVSRAYGLLVNPVETFRTARNDPVTGALLYILALFIVNAIFTALLAAAGLRTPAAGTPAPEGYSPVIALIFLIPVGGLLGIVIGSVWIHLWVRVAGGIRPLDSTVLATAYSSTPSAAFGWMPFIGILFFFWSLILLVIGIREIQELSTGRAVLAIAGAILVPLLLIVIAALLFLMPVSSVTTVVPS